MSELTIYLDVSTPLNLSVWMAEAEAGDGAHPDAAGYAEELAQLVQSWSTWSNCFNPQHESGLLSV